MEKSKGGRPVKHTYEQLREVLLEYAHQHPGGQIRISDLARETKFPRHVWRNNKQIQEDIKALNESPIEVVTLLKEQLSIPSAADLVNANYRNKNQLIEVVQQLLEAYQITYEQASKTKQLEEALASKEDELERVVTEKDMEIKKHKELAEYYEQQYKEMCIHSTSLRGREKYNLKENVISVEKKMPTLEDEFEELFD